MKIYNIEQKLIGFKQTYSVCHNEGNTYLEVTSSGIGSVADRILGSILSVGHNLYIKDLDGNKYATIKKHYGLLLEKYDIFYDGRKLAQIRQSIRATKPKFVISTEKNMCEINGDIMARDFTIIRDGMCLAKVSKRRFNIKDRYKLEILNLDCEMLMIASVICIDNSIHN